MTARQFILKSIYPVFQLINKIFKMNMQVNNSGIKANASFYDLEMKQNTGEVMKFQTLKNKKVLVVNTASDCGYTSQYDGLQKLYNENKEDLVVLAFPANDFGQQEKKDDNAIEEFCRVNYGVTFPVMSKSIVVKSREQNEVFSWLTDKVKNGWNEDAPSWNFCKYLVDEKGNLTHIFAAAIEPSDDKILDAIKEKADLE